TGIYVPWIQGGGDLEVGDDVHISGKLSVTFAARFAARPLLRIGARTDIAHDCRIVVGKEVIIGEGVELAGGVTIRDSGGHPADPARRAGGAPPGGSDGQPGGIHHNAWDGPQGLVLPGSRNGRGSIGSGASGGGRQGPPYTIVAG